MRSLKSINFMPYRRRLQTVKGHTDFIPLEIRVFAHGFHYIVTPYLEFVPRIFIKVDRNFSISIILNSSLLVLWKFSISKPQ